MLVGINAVEQKNLFLSRFGGASPDHSNGETAPAQSKLKVVHCNGQDGSNQSDWLIIAYISWFELLNNSNIIKSLFIVKSQIFQYKYIVYNNMLFFIFPTFKPLPIEKKTRGAAAHSAPPLPVPMIWWIDLNKWFSKTLIKMMPLWFSYLILWKTSNICCRCPN